MTIHPCDADRQRIFALGLLRWLAEEANHSLDRRRRSLESARRVADAYGLPRVEVDRYGRAVLPDIDKAPDM